MFFKTVDHNKISVLLPKVEQPFLNKLKEDNGGSGSTSDNTCGYTCSNSCWGTCNVSGCQSETENEQTFSSLTPKL